jgi:hypothetical protein
MTDDLMHERLTRAGQDWRRAQPPLELDPAPTMRPRRPIPAYAAAAAAVLAIAGGGWAVGSLGGDDPRPAPPVESLPRPAHGVVAWKNLAPTHVGTPANLPPCSADELHATPSMGGAAGTAYLDLELSGTGDPCRLEGVPQVTLLDHGTRIPVYSSDVGHTNIRPVVVTSSPSATLTIGWSVSHSCEDVDNDQIRVTLPDGSSFTTPGFGPTSCNPGEPALSELSVEPFRPIDTGVGDLSTVRTRPAEGRSIALAGSPGQRLEFTVRVVSPRRVVLDPCPDYRIQLYYGDYGLSEEHEYALNCAAIPTRDPQGRPVLLPGRPVEFQMFVTAPKVDVPKLLWLLDGVRPRHSHAYGGITVE